MEDHKGILEGLNSLIQAAKAKARGYRTFKNLKTIIYMLTGKLDYAKVGLPTWNEKEPIVMNKAGLLRK